MDGQLKEDIKFGNVVVTDGLTGRIERRLYENWGYYTLLEVIKEWEIQKSVFYNELTVRNIYS